MNNADVAYQHQPDVRVLNVGDCLARIGVIVQAILQDAGKVEEDQLDDLLNELWIHLQDLGTTNNSEQIQVIDTRYPTLVDRLHDLAAIPSIEHANTYSWNAFTCFTFMGKHADVAHRIFTKYRVMEMILEYLKSEDERRICNCMASLHAYALIDQYPVIKEQIVDKYKIVERMVEFIKAPQSPLVQQFAIMTILNIAKNAPPHIHESILATPEVSGLMIKHFNETEFSWARVFWQNMANSSEEVLGKLKDLHIDAMCDKFLKEKNGNDIPCIITLAFLSSNNNKGVHLPLSAVTELVRIADAIISNQNSHATKLKSINIAKGFVGAILLRDVSFILKPLEILAAHSQCSRHLAVHHRLTQVLVYGLSLPPMDCAHRLQIVRIIRVHHAQSLPLASRLFCLGLPLILACC